MKDDTRVNHALKLCELSDFKRSDGSSVRLAATIYRGNDLIAQCVNKMKTHPVMQKYSCNSPYPIQGYLHAEMGALINAGWQQGTDNLRGCVIYVARKLNIPGRGNAKPCPVCRAAIIDAGIKKIVFTISDGYSVEYIK